MDLGNSSRCVEKFSRKGSSAMVVIVACSTRGRGSSQPYIGGWASVPESG